jgi:uncharacterized protein YunC (DUF1805 family)
MNTITIKHDRLRNGNFPVNELEDIIGITITKSKGVKTFEEIYSITINTSIHKEPVQDIACELGMMIQSHIMTNIYLK